MSTAYTRFQTKKAQKPYPLERHIPIWFTWGSTPPPRPGRVTLSKERLVLVYPSALAKSACACSDSLSP